MPQVKSKIESAWYVNRAKDVDGKPRSLTLGTITFAPEQERFIEARVLLESRHNDERFKTALGNGNLVVKGAKVEPVVEPPAEPEVEPEVDENVFEPEVDENVFEPEVDENVFEPEVEPKDSAAKRAVSKRRRGK
jgi:hypothetical protein